MLRFLTDVIVRIRDDLQNDFLKEEYRVSDTDFTRDRKISFSSLIMWMLRKWIKSTQLMLNELFLDLWFSACEITTNSAYTQARAKLSYKLFIHLDQKYLVEKFYNKHENTWWFTTWEGFRLCGIDGSKMRLPDEKDIKDVFGTIKINNGKGIVWEYTGALLSACYDVENNMALHCILENGKYNERACAIRHIEYMEEQMLSWKIDSDIQDLLLFDRWYVSKFFLWVLFAYRKEFVCRIPEKRFHEAEELFDPECKINSKIVMLDIEESVRKDRQEYEEKYEISIPRDIPKTVQVRFVRVVLDDGSIEILVTSLLDEKKYPDNIFKELYFKRWGVETYYDILKNKLLLENFSWKTIHAVFQDVFSTIFLSNLEALFVRVKNKELAARKKSKYKTSRTISKKTQYKTNSQKNNKKNSKSNIRKKLKNKQQVNKQVSFNCIKNFVIDLFLSQAPVETLIHEMMQIFSQNTTPVRPWRSFPRNKKSFKQALNFAKTKRKHVF